MALTQFQKLELNKRVDKILHAPASSPAGGQQLEMVFVADMTADRTFIEEAFRESAATLKAHDRIFQNVRSNVVYWRSENITTTVMPLSLIHIGKAFADDFVDKSKGNVDSVPYFDVLCGYCKLFHARSRCILVFTTCEPDKIPVKDWNKAVENLNPFLKYRILLITPKKMVTGSELLLRFMREGEEHE